MKEKKEISTTEVTTKVAPVETEMNLRSCLDFEIEKEGRRYCFKMPMGAPLGEAFDVCFAVLEKVKELAANAVKNVDPSQKKG